MKKNYQTKYVIHFLVWFIFFLILMYDYFFNNGPFNYFLFILFLVCVCIFYINFNFLVERFIVKKKWLLYTIILLILFGLTYTVISIASVKFDYLRANFRPPSIPANGIRTNIPANEINLVKREPPMHILPNVVIFLFVISISSFLKLYEFLNENFKRQKEIENENRITELNFLKAQLNPHFFFNSLNTIYFLSIVQSPKTPQAILNLSDLMRYMLSDKNNTPIDKKVDLQEEIEYINNYIELQKLRITSNNTINYKVEGNLKSVKIYPLLFISFIENAFKYGVHPVYEEEILIEFKIKDGILDFNVENQIHFQKKSYDSFSLGNENSIKRLNLYYPNNSLVIKNNNNKYQVSIKIDLNEN
ncbi:sensor histidine kinase [Flavobacterium sp. J27]|uniref:sensor histidine kinase n=1 Tax=Flavobacterium sp. J27 TaxID=2060419 RepID=UPI0013EEABB8|nr:sensor histidine kinase [Flavobacterium sp. J27]